jgi:hypothetical protein
VHYDDKKVTMPADWDSIIFKTMFNDKEKYIVKQDEFRKALESVRARGTTLFVVTNSHIDNINTTMGFAYGEVCVLRRKKENIFFILKKKK